MRAREVERQSSPGVQTFDDDDRGVIILEATPSSLAYADPSHAFALPPGRFLRLDQAAGRVYDATATPHLEALTAAAAVALADSVGRLLDGAGWQRVPGSGTGADAVREAARFAASGNGGFGVTEVGTWRVPRAAAAWAALPPGTRPRPTVWNGVEVAVTVRPVGAVTSPSEARFILQVAVSDRTLGGELNAMVAARRQRRGSMGTLSDWDAHPDEPLPRAP